MARIRTIKPEFATNEKLGSCSMAARLTAALITCHADREGRLEDRPTRLKVLILPYDECDMNAILDELDAIGFIVRYQVEGLRFIQVVNFEKHQRPNAKELPSVFPKYVPEQVQHDLENSRISNSVEKIHGSIPVPVPYPVPDPDPDLSTESSTEQDPPELAAKPKSALQGWFESEFKIRYPAHRRVQEPTALRELRKLRPSKEQREQIIASLDEWVASSDWIRDQGKFVPGMGRFFSDKYYQRQPENRRDGPAVVGMDAVKQVLREIRSAG